MDRFQGKLKLSSLSRTLVSPLPKATPKTSYSTQIMKTYPCVSRICVSLCAITTFGLLLVGTVLGQTIPNPSFEADTFNNFPGYISGNAPITGWTANNNDRVGINPGGGSPFADNGTIPDGHNVAFLQSFGSDNTTLSTTISDLVPGNTYKVTFRCNARGGQTPILKVEIDGTLIVGVTVASVGGTNPYKYCVFDFTATDTTHGLTLRNDTDAGGDNTVCVDDFRIAIRNSGWSYAAWTSDADSGVDGSKTYTHAFNFGSGVNAVINGITFTGKAGGNPSQAGSFSTVELGNVFPNDGNNLSAGGSRTMANDFCYGNAANTVVQSLTLNGLFPGGEYLATIYSVGWENGPVRGATFSVGNDRLTVNQDHFGNDNGIRVSYRFTAASSSVTLVYEPLQAATFHTYGFSVQQVSLPSSPTISQHPRSQCVGVGDTVTFSVVAGGSQPLFYRWRKGVDELPGETNPTLTLPSVTTAAAGQYSVVVSNNVGSVTSLVATLAVGIAIANPSFEVDSFAIFPGYVNDNGPITGWTALGGHGVNPGVGFSPFADNGATPDGEKVAFMQQDGALSQTLSGFTPGADYYVVYYENARSGGVPSIEVRVGGTTVVPAHPRSPVGGGNPYIQMISDAFKASASSLELSFIKSNPTGGDTTALIDYVCVLELPSGTAPTITRQPQPQVVLSGGSAAFSVGAFGSQPLTYQWLKDGVPINGANSQTLTFATPTANDEGLYSVIVSNSAGHATSDSARLTIFQPIPDLFNTGVDSSRAALADGAIDPHYVFIVNPDTGSPDAIVEQSTTFPIVSGPWVANSSISKWIGPRLNTAASAGPADYVYRTTIDLTDRDPSTVIILGRWAVDNTGLDIRVNGVSTGNPQSPGFSDYTAFSISNGVNATFVAGVNTIDFLVRNEQAVGYTGLRVEILASNVRIPPGIPPTVTGHPQDRIATTGDTVSFNVAATGSPVLRYQWKKDGVELPGQTQATLNLVNVAEADSGFYSALAINDWGTNESHAASLCVCIRRLTGVAFGTGVDDTGAPAANGSADLHYILAASVDPNFQGPEAYVVNDNGFPIPPWIASGPKSKWIGPQADQSFGNAEGDYTYQTFIDLTGYDPTKVRLVGQWAADNTGLDILVNGVSTGAMSPGFDTFTPFIISSGLQAGLNVLDFQMNNLPTTPNPTGLRVDLEAQVTIPSSVLSCPPAVVAECTGGLTPVTFTATAVDVSGAPVPVTCVPPSGTGFLLGESNVVCTASDRFGGSSTCAFTVTVVDTTPPSVNCPGDIRIDSTVPATVTYIATAADACGIGSFACTPPSGSLFPTGTTTVTCRATDGTGNSNSCNFSVTVAPANAPPVCAAQVACALTFANDTASYLLTLNGSDACTILDGSQSSDADGDSLSFQWFVAPSPLPFAVGSVVTNCFDLGCHSVVVVVTDSKGASCATNINLCVIPACNAVDKCTELVDNSAISRKNKRPLTASLKAACASFDRGDFVPAMNQLEAFQNKVRAQVAPANPAEAAAFIDCAQRILDAITCEAVLGSQGDGHGHH